MKQITQSAAQVVDRPTEIEPVATGYIEEDTNDRRERDTAERLWLLWEHRRFLWRTTIWGFIIASIIAFLIPPRYESTTQIMPPDPQSGTGLAMMAALAGRGGQGTLGSLGLSSLTGDLLGMKSSGALFTSILHSRTVEDRLIQRFDLRKVYWDKYWEDARKDLAKYTDISEDRKSGVLTITVTDRDRRRAQQIAQAYVEELNNIVALVSTSAARRERIFLEQRLQEVKRNLDTAASQFAEYASKNTVLDSNSQTKAMVESAAVLQGQLIAAQSELESLQQIYTGNNVRVRALKARVDELRSQLEKMGGTNDTADSVNSTTSSAPASQSDQLYPSLRKLPLLGIRWLELYRETKIQETIYELLTQQYELAKIQEAKEIPTVKVLDVPEVAEKKSSPKRLVLMALGALLAFSTAVVWVLCIATWQQMDVQDSRKQLGQEVVARSLALWSRFARGSRTMARAEAWRKLTKKSPEDLD